MWGINTILRDQEHLAVFAVVPSSISPRLMLGHNVIDDALLR